MAARASKEPQRFPAYFAEKWRQKILQNDSTNNTEIKHHVEAILSGDNLPTQLSSIKKLQQCNSTISGNDIVTFLVEVHSRSSSRHPVQRNTAKVLDILYQSGSDHVISSAISDCLIGMIGMGVVSNVLFVEYVQSLMEYYTAGERMLYILLPKVLHHFSVIIHSQWKDQSLNSIPSHCNNCFNMFKCLLNVLQHTQPLLFKLIEPHCHDYDDKHDVIMVSSELGEILLKDIQWPEGGDRQWLINLLMDLQSYTERILKEGTNHPRDLLMATAMVTIITMATIHQSSLVTVFPLKYRVWFNNTMTTPTQYPLLSQLCLINGILVKLSFSQINSILINDNYKLIKESFSLICYLLDRFTESSDRYMASRVLSVWTELLSNNITDIVQDDGIDVSPLSSDIIKRLLEYIWSHWDDPIDGIRHQVKNIFDNIVQLYVTMDSHKVSTDNYIEILSRSLLSLSPPTRGKYTLLSALVPHLNINETIASWPHLPNEIMSTMGQQIIACRAGELWNALVHKHFNETDLNNWKKTWVEPLVTRLLTGNPLAKQHIKQYCLQSLFAISSIDVLSIVNETVDSLSHDLSCDQTDILTVRLMCIGCRGNDDVITPGDEDILKMAVQHGDEQVIMRVVVSAFHILCSSTKTTSLPTVSSLTVILNCISLHISVQSPWIRQQMLASSKKLFMRIADGTYKIVKEQKKRAHKLTDDVSLLLKSYEGFLTTLVTKCFKHLQNSLSTFQARYFSLSILALMSQIFQNSVLPQFQFSSLIPDPLAKGLVHILWDSFESNRLLAVELIIELNRYKSDLFNDSTLSYLTEQCHQLITSPKYTHCSTGYHLIKLLLQISPEKLINSFNTGISSPETSLPTTSLSLIKHLMGVLDHHVSGCRRSLVVGSINHPMYGVIQSIRGVWECTSSDTVGANIDGYHQLCVDIISQCTDISSIVASIVCNTSPEGYLPSTDDITDQGGAGFHGNSQSVLLCSWHCMKEVIQLLTSLIRTAQCITDTTLILLTSTEIDAISKLLIQQLTEARHRGAFEMAYVGFSKLCDYIWSYSNRPEIWINELLSTLNCTSAMSSILSITRRSAGLPFYCQAIVITEPKNRNHKCLKELMSQLLPIATSHTTQCNELVPVSSCVHSLNILRGLIRESKLGETIVPYIGAAVKIAIEGFKSSYWPIRNSSTLLLSSLIQRIFGVKKVQDERSIENKMTAREFFTRFPTLHKYLLDTLNQSLSTNETESLFPVLLVLSNLYPSHLDDINSSLSLVPFQDPIIKSASSPVWKCRVLSAHALLPTVTCSTLTSLVSQLISQLSIARQNSLHGVLLMIQVILVEYKSGLFKQEINSNVLELLQKLTDKYHIGTKVNPCPITRGLYLHCISLILQLLATKGVYQIADISVHEQLLKLVHENQLHLSTGEREILDLELPSYQLSFLLTAYGFFKSTCSVLSPLQMALLSWQHHPNMEVAYDCLSGSLVRGDLTEDDLNRITLAAVDKVCEDVHYSYQLLTALTNKWDGEAPGHLGVNWTELFQSTVTKLVTQSLREEVKVAIIDWLSSYIEFYKKHDDTIKHLMSTLRIWCSDIYPESVRVAISRLLGNNWSQLSSMELTVPDICQYWYMVVLLIQDIEVNVRLSMCRSIYELIIKNRDHLPTSLCHQSTLQELIKLVPTLYSTGIAVSVLLYLSKISYDCVNSNAVSQQDTISSLLFEEDQSNSFVDSVQLVEYIVETLDSILRDLSADVRNNYILMIQESISTRSSDISISTSPSDVQVGTAESITVVTEFFNQLLRKYC